MKLKPIKPVPACIALGVIVLFCLLRCLHLELFERLEFMSFDWRAREALHFSPTIATNLGFVAIDEQSIAQIRNGSLGLKFGLYWPRQVYGRLVQELSLQGARAVAFDIIFGELRPDHPPVTMADGGLVDSDEFFALQMRQASNVVLALTTEVTPPALFLTNASALGDITTDKDSDGILRRARAFRLYRNWHAAFRQVEADVDYGVDLAQARIESGQVVLPRSNGELIKVPLDSEGCFRLADFWGEKLPAGMAPQAKPFEEERVWHMGLVLAARELGLDLSKAQVDLPHGRIVLRGAGGLERIIPVEPDGHFYIDWCLPPKHAQLTAQSIQGVLEQNFRRLKGQTNGLSSPWKGKLVVVGSSAVVGNNMTDRGATPLQADTLLVSKHWNVANSVITGRFVHRAPLGVELALIVFLGVGAAFLTWELRPQRASALVLLVLLAYALAAVVVYVQTRYWIPLVLPLGGGWFMTYVLLLCWQVIFEQAEHRRVRAVFSTMVSPKIVKELLMAPSLALGGARRQITVLFADVRGFTAFTDGSQEAVADLVRQRNLSGAAAEACFDEQARETLNTINQYLGLVAETIVQHDGTLDKFIGDCVMAFWGAPTPNPKHALSCVRSAIEAQRAIYQFNRQREKDNHSLELENMTRMAAGLEPKPLLPVLLLGTGINTGMATMGIMGWGIKTGLVRAGNYTVFGREINLASRLEGASGRGHIYISHSTYEHLRRDDPALAASCLELTPITVKGIRTAVQVYEVPWRPDDAPLLAAELAPKPQTDTSTSITRVIVR